LFCSVREEVYRAGDAPAVACVWSAYGAATPVWCGEESAAMESIRERKK